MKAAAMVGARYNIRDRIKAAFNAARDLGILDRVGAVRVASDGETTVTMKDGRAVTLEGSRAIANEWDEVFEDSNGNDQA